VTLSAAVKGSIVAVVIQNSALGAYGYFDNGMTGDFEVEVLSTESVNYAFDGGITVTFTGENLGFDETEAPVGTIFGVTFTNSADDETLGTISGLSVSATSLYEATVLNGNFNGFMATLLQGDDTQTGSTSRDAMYGFEGNDTLFGGGGNDPLYGGVGNDTLIGGTGNDVLFGDVGTDVMRGGGGRDTFFFADRFVHTPPSAVFAQRDTVRDFNISQRDSLHLGWIDANYDKADDQSFKFIGTRDFHNKAGELRFEIKKNDTFVYGDTDGDGEANFVIELDGQFELTGNDFVL
jgi:Ca2+-binding RTX toxin-like protein